ncbi:bacteriocin transport accessory protein (plasmid) [Levilactobacillus brevis]|uniref:Bacteriocin transport accessory protein n=1 Tax=Levilactobacillus brevis TaxID=1580 RepID=C0SQN8_LEVBR|nr:bacteriocin transport accessory protein [Levilactobacillus brevis]BAH56420.1 bacteriocin transport accessory protein [Levilactobacillus brevis]BAU19433.1 bacteriocin transport accessory protein [Levilactobacillus brevis]
MTHVTFKQYGNNIKRTHEVTPVKLTSLLKSKKTYYLFFGFRGCPYCRNFSKTLAKFMKQSKTRPVYYVNIENFGSDLNPNSTMYKDLQNFIEKKVVLKTTPTIVAMKGNKMMRSFRDSRTSLKQLQNLNVKLIKSK